MDPGTITAAMEAGGYFGFVAPPIVIAPPVLVGPPIGYYGPPGYYPPPVYAAPAAGQGCYAGPYVCPLDTPAGVGAPCSCPAKGSRVFGVAG